MPVLFVFLKTSRGDIEHTKAQLVKTISGSNLLPPANQTGQRHQTKKKKKFVVCKIHSLLQNLMFATPTFTAAIKQDFICCSVVDIDKIIFIIIFVWRRASAYIYWDSCFSFVLPINSQQYPD